MLIAEAQFLSVDSSPKCIVLINAGVVEDRNYLKLLRGSILASICSTFDVGIDQCNILENSHVLLLVATNSRPRNTKTIFVNRI